MQMAMFKIAPPPLAVANPVLMAPPPKPIETLAEPKPVTVSPPKKQAVKPPVKEVVKLETPKPVVLKPPKIETKQKPVIKEKIAVIKPKPKLKKKVKKKVKLKTKKKTIKTKRVAVKKKPKVKPRKITPPKRKVIVKKRVIKKPHHVRKAQAPIHRPSPKKAISKRVVRHTSPKQRAVIQKHGRPKARQVSKPRQVVRAKPVIRPATQPKVVSNPHLERQYEQGIRQRIEQKKVYPRLAKRMRKQGVVKVAFTISRNGIVSKLRIVQSSGVKSLDKAALKAVKKVGRFPPIPAGIRKQSLSYIIPISYKIR
jgi:protein TonB